MSDIIIRGIRGKRYKDIKEDRKLVTYYSVDIKKLKYIKIPRKDEFSSKKLKNLIKEGKSDLVRKFAPKEVIDLIKNKTSLKK